MKFKAACCLTLLPILVFSQSLLTPFEKSGGRESATYFECIQFYKVLDKLSPKIAIRTKGMSDAGYPYDVVLFSNDGQFDPAGWHAKNKMVLLIINGIHPGEPDGIDASMMLLRDFYLGKIKLPDNIVLAVIPVYNIGGALNRNSYSRVNQDGPASYGFRGNSQNLDLNRDFTKCDTRDSKSFTEIFHWLNPDVQLDNHVSDGADYQYTMTMISTQWNKLGGKTGDFLHDHFGPALNIGMDKAGWPMCPYVNLEEGNLQKGWQAFMDYPRYSSGYAALFHVISFISETHMLKPFKDRVMATYAFMNVLIKSTSDHASQISRFRKEDIEEDKEKDAFALNWSCDTSLADTILFSGYEADTKPSSVSGQLRLYYDRSRPFKRRIPYFDYFKTEKIINPPTAYIIPQGWHDVIDLLQLNGIKMKRFMHDTIIQVQAYHIDDYKTFSKPYEKHHKNYDTHVSVSIQNLRFLKGDYLIPLSQGNKRFLIEMLEPTGDDSYFSWNFFDAILQQKEGYSDYRWEDVAANYLLSHPELKAELEEKKKSDAAFGANPGAQLEFIYRKSPYYEPAHMRYPVYRLLPVR